MAVLGYGLIIFIFAGCSMPDVLWPGHKTLNNRLPYAAQAHSSNGRNAYHRLLAPRVWAEQPAEARVSPDKMAPNEEITVEELLQPINEAYDEGRFTQAAYLTYRLNEMKPIAAVDRTEEADNRFYIELLSKSGISGRRLTKENIKTAKKLAYQRLWEDALYGLKNEDLSKINIAGSVQIVGGWNDGVDEKFMAWPDSAAGSSIISRPGDYLVEMETLRDMLGLINASCRKRVAAGDCLLIGPGRKTDEIETLLRIFPDIRSISIIDNDKQNLLLIKKELDARKDISPEDKAKITLHHCNASDMPFEEKKFSLCFASWVFDKNLPSDESRLGVWINELKRCLKSDGVAIIYGDSISYFDRAGFKFREFEWPRFTAALSDKVFADARHSTVWPQTLNGAANKTLLAPRVWAERETYINAQYYRFVNGGIRLSGMHRQINVNVADFFKGNSAGYVKDFNAQDFSVFGYVNKKTLFQLEGFFYFCFAAAELNIERICFFVKRDLHRSYLLKPIDGYYDYFVAGSFIDNLKRFSSENSSRQHPAVKCRQGLNRFKDSLFYEAPWDFALFSPCRRMLSIDDAHVGKIIAYQSIESQGAGMLTHCLAPRVWAERGARKGGTVQEYAKRIKDLVLKLQTLTRRHNLYFPDIPAPDSKSPLGLFYESIGEQIIQHLGPSPILLELILKKPDSEEIPQWLRTALSGIRETRVICGLFKEPESCQAFVEAVKRMKYTGAKQIPELCPLTLGDINPMMELIISGKIIQFYAGISAAHDELIEAERELNSIINGVTLNGNLDAGAAEGENETSPTYHDGLSDPWKEYQLYLARRVAEEIPALIGSNAFTESDGMAFCNSPQNVENQTKLAAVVKTILEDDDTPEIAEGMVETLLLESEPATIIYVAIKSELSRRRTQGAPAGVVDSGGAAEGASRLPVAATSSILIRKKTSSDAQRAL